MVALMQYGAQWRAVVPSEIEARIDDLIEGARHRAAPDRASRHIAVVVPNAPLAPGISELLARAEAESRRRPLRGVLQRSS